MTELAYAPAPGGRQRATWDVVLSVLFLVGTVVAYVIGAASTVFAMAFTDYCPPGCDIDAGVNSVFTVGFVLAVLDLAAIVVTIILLVTRRRAWWLGLVAGVLTVIGWIVAFALYIAAISPN